MSERYELRSKKISPKDIKFEDLVGKKRKKENNKKEKSKKEKNQEDDKEGEMEEDKKEENEMEEDKKEENKEENKDNSLKEDNNNDDINSLNNNINDNKNDDINININNNIEDQPDNIINEDPKESFNENDKKEDDKEDNKIKIKKDDEMEGKNKEILKIKRCCLKCKNSGCCLCTNKPVKCESCLYHEYIFKGFKTRVHTEMEIHPKKQKFPFVTRDPYQEIELRSFHSIERENTENNLASDLNAPFFEQQNRQNNRRRTRINLILCALYLICIVYFTIVFRGARGFEFRTTTSLYVMILGLYALKFINNIQKLFR